MALDIRTRKRKGYTPSPGDVFLDDNDDRYLLALDATGGRLAISLDTWLALPASDIKPKASLDAILILTEED